MRFKKIIPCVLLSACVASSVFAMSACSSGTDYSEDITKLQQQIDTLKTENKNLTDQISSITPSDKDYSEEIEELQQQLETLKTANGGYTTEIEKLQQQIETLKTANGSNLTEIEKLQKQLETLKTENAQLTEQANNQQLLIESLQNTVNIEPKIYKVGETFTYSYQGVDFFSLTLETTNSTIGNTFRIKNLNMSGGVPVNSYIRGIAYSIETNDIYIAKFIEDSLNPGSEYLYIRSPLENFKQIHLGFPSGEDGIIPYAIFELTTSV